MSTHRQRVREHIIKQNDVKRKLVKLWQTIHDLELHLERLGRPANAIESEKLEKLRKRAVEAQVDEYILEHLVID